MESELGKLFVGGISWDTDEDRLREYFKSFGEVVEAVIMKDRATGRARGFGFVVFADPSVAERVVMEKHLIDGRLVEAKKAVPRDDPHILNRCVGILPGSPCPGRTKKIFVGGLASTVTDSDFKKYFEQFGTITDVVVMYDHNTQRPRGFGFITFDSEDAVDKVLHKTFHELNGKMVEVKRAVPKELSPGPNVRLPIGGLNQQGLNRVNSFLNGYNPGFSQSSAGSFGMRMDGRFGQLPSARKMLPSFNPAYGAGMNFDSGTSLNYGGGSSGYGRALNQYYGASSHRFGSPMNPNLSFGSSARNIWTNGNLNYNAAPSNSSGSLAGFGSNSGLNWAGSSSPLATHGGGRDSNFGVGNSGYGIGETNFGLAMGGYGRSNGTAASVNSSFAAASNGYEGNYADAYGGGSIYGDLTWQSASTELDGSSPFAYGLGATRSDVMAKGSAGYMGGYNVANRQMNRDG